jgi:hypothetical protein
MRSKQPHDHYPTPPWAIEKLLQLHRPPPSVPIVEPSAGSGHIVQILAAHGYDVEAVELQAKFRDHLVYLLGDPDRVHIGDWQKLYKNWLGRPLSIVGNLPYTLAEEHLACVFELNPVFCALLFRLDFLGSQRRMALFEKHPINDLVIMARRPSFWNSGKTDRYNYAWFVWREGVASPAIRFIDKPDTRKPRTKKPPKRKPKLEPIPIELASISDLTISTAFDHAQETTTAIG